MNHPSEEPSLILIVDDTPANLRVISEALNDAGFEIAIATSGERALEQCQREQPDLILLDIMMPGIGGFETCRRLKADPELKDVPVIFMTALADVESKIEGLELGAVDYITKPFREREVIARVKTHLELRQTQLKLKRSEERMSNILGSLREIVWSALSDPFELLYLNRAVETIYGYPAANFLENPQDWLEKVHNEDRPHLLHQLSSAQPDSEIDLEYRIIRADGEIRWVHCQASVHWDEATRCTRFDGIVQDISDRKLAESRLRYTAEHDSLTHLANRAYFMKQLSQVLLHPRERRSDQFALLFIDLDRFKTINDSLGHGVGDQLLIRVGEILRESTRPSDVVARLGGDEFTVLLKTVGQIDDAILVSDRIQSALKKPMLLQQQSLLITASIGIVSGANDYQSAEEMLRDADIAMYQAKNLGKACHQLFSPEMYQQAMRKLTLENELRTAIERKEFFLVYQPIKKLESGEVAGFEALVRWKHPERGLISPGEFIPLAEETGLIITLGEYILREACTQMSRWQQRCPDLSHLTMSINLSSRQLQSSNFLDNFDRIIQQSCLSPSNLKLEITESLLMEDNEKSLHLFTALQQRGLRLSLDDFGTGYSSLSYLHRFPINTLKIDRSFIQKMQPGENSFEIIRTITALAQTLQMDVVAEGVETAQQAEYLKNLHCDMVQGYFFSKPLNAEMATAYLQQEFDCEWFEEDSSVERTETIAPVITPNSSGVMT